MYIIQKIIGERKWWCSENDKENTAAIVDGDMWIIYYESSVNFIYYTSDWVNNSGASFYVIAYCGYFTSYTKVIMAISDEKWEGIQDYGNKKYLLGNQCEL